MRSRVRAIFLASFLTACATPGLRHPLAGNGLLEDVGLVEKGSEGVLTAGMGEIRYDLKEKRLPSGLWLAAEKVKARGMVSIALNIAFGARQDPADQAGLAHWLEHLVFRMPVDAEGTSFSSALTLLGATGVNAFTDPTSTTFVATVPRKSLEPTLAVMSQLFRARLDRIDPRKVALEKAIVLNEALDRDETGEPGQLVRWVYQAAYAPGHPNLQPTGGTRDTIMHLNINSASDAVRKNYLPHKATLSLVGDFERDDFMVEVEQLLPKTLLLGQIPVLEDQAPSPIKFDDTLPANPKEGFYEHKALGLMRPRALAVWRLPSIYGEGGKYSHILASPRAYERMLREIEGFNGVRSASVTPIYHRDDTLLLLSIEFDDTKQWREVTGVAIDNMRDPFMYLVDEAKIRAANHPVFERQWQMHAQSERLLHNRQRVILQSLLESEAFSTRASRWAEFALHRGEAVYYAMLMQGVLGTSNKMVAITANTFLDPKRARVLLISPDEAPQALPSIPQEAGEAARVAAKAEAATVFGPPPVAEQPLELQPQNRRVLRLGNGMQVILLRREQFPTTAATLVFKGGMVQAPDPAAARYLRFIERLVQRELNTGWLNWFAADPADADIDVVVSGSENIHGIFFRLAQRIRITEALFEADANEQEKSKAEPKGSSDKHEATQVAKPDPREVAYEQVSRSLYGESFLGTGVKSEQILALSMSNLKAAASALRAPTNAVLVVVSSLPLDALEWSVNIWFGKWAPKTASSPDNGWTAPPISPRAPQMIVEHLGGTSRIEMGLACRLPSKGPHQATVNEIAGSVLASWLSTRLRYDAGVTYGVESNVRNLRGGTSDLLIKFSVNDRQFREALRITTGVWQSVLAGNVDPGTLSQIRWTGAVSSNARFQTAAEVALTTALAMNRSNGESVSEVFETLANSSGTPATADDIRLAFATCQDSMVFSYVGDKKLIDAELATKAQTHR